jgi:hypothetical protein
MSWLSSPLEVTVDDLYIVLGPIMNSSRDGDRDLNPLEYSDSSEDELSFDGKLCEDRASDSESDESYDELPPPPPPKPTKKSAIERYLQKVLMNLTLNINNLHIRYEDETYPYLHPFSFGVCLD